MNNFLVFVFLLFHFVTFCFGQEFSFGPCPPFPVVQNFDVKRVNLNIYFQLFKKSELSFIFVFFSKLIGLMASSLVQWLRQWTHDQKIVGSSPGAVYWMENFFNAMKENGENKGSQIKQTAKKYFKKTERSCDRRKLMSYPCLNNNFWSYPCCKPLGTP